MTPSYLFVVLGLLSFAAMGILHKLGDRLQAEPLPIAFYALVSAGLLSALRVIGTHAVANNFPPAHIIFLALPFGGCAGLSLWCLQKGLRHGSIATSWLIINLSAAIPTVLSILFYREAVGWKKASVLGLVIISLLLLWWDRRNSSRRSGAAPAIVTKEVI